MTVHEHILVGCAPIPLAGYLKALGAFRAVAGQADGDSRGFWYDERFVLRTRLTEGELLQFFVEKYRPTSVVAPWNGGSGFWKKDNHDGLDAIKASDDVRLVEYKAAIRACEAVIREHNLSEAPKGAVKAKFLLALRATLSEGACRWLDGAISQTGQGLRYPPILGTGGNDGRLDFSNNFIRRFIQVIDCPIRDARESLQSSLFNKPSIHITKGAVGQFAPGSAGGVNAGVGFEAESYVNPWDFVFVIEGALAFAAAAVRRHAQDRTVALGFPFTARPAGAGSGALSMADEADSRAEFFAPLWSRAIGLEEMLQFMSEGRATLNGRMAWHGLDFPRAAAQFGVARGITAFQRYSFLMRAGKAHFAVPLGRIRVQENPGAGLISELDAGSWLSSVHSALRNKHIPTSLGAIGRQLDDACFRLAGDSSAESVQDVLIAVGSLAIEVGRRPELRNSGQGSSPLPPPPRLSRKWAIAADDGSQEFALAAAVASLDATAVGSPLPFRRHLAPLDWLKGEEGWSDATASRAHAVWTGRDLVRDMASVLERRLIAAHRHSFVNRDNRAELPLRGGRGASLVTIASFLAGRTDDRRVAILAAGLAWARLHMEPRSEPRGEGLVPFAYAALKPMFGASGPPSTSGGGSLLDPLRLVRMIRSGRAPEAIRLAQHVARTRGLLTPFAQQDPAPPPDAERLVAALLFPLTPEAQGRLNARVYSDVVIDKEEPNAA